MNMHLIKFQGANSVVHVRQFKLGEAIELSGKPQGKFEANTNEFIRSIVTKVEGELPLDPCLFPIDVRAAIICHYIAYHNGFKEGDFKIGKDQKYSDFLDRQSDAEYPEYIKAQKADPELFESPEVKGGFLKFHILNGYGAEALENLCKTKGEWLRGIMALQLRHTHEPEIDANLAAYAIYLKERIDTLAALDFNVMDNLMNLHDIAASQYPMLLWPDVDKDGILFLPYMAVRSTDEMEVVDITGTRFCVRHIYAGRTWL